MDKINFSFRDYVSYMLPGALVMFSGFLFDPGGVDWLESHKFVSGMIFLLGGYILGFFLNSISHMLVIKRINNIFGSPNSILSGKSSRFFNKLDPVFNNQLKKVLIREWGEDLVQDGDESNLLILCLRQSQMISHPAIDTLDRQVSLYEFLAGMIVAIPIFSSLLIFGGYVVIGILSFAFTYIAVIRFYVLRRRFIVNVYRIFFIQHKELKP